ncbi:uncharacterized protein LOC108907431 [Anoplophora glabripennis]|uniref:uncharacterized protein LOC108907431 n=1 Tax=Anoplophora glabripennis TaxID=217634 RepID=UPI0008753593|nr:uncharacterized protein LOC108907431 [Anoplophora glabripennis]
MEVNYKCGYCGWLLNNYCQNYWDHKCFTDFNERRHDLVSDPNNVLTVVEKPREMLNNCETECETDSQEELELGSNFDEAIIAMVAERRALYDFKLPLNQRTKAKKEDLWKEISNNLGGVGILQIKQRWKYLRDSFVRAKKKVKEYRPSGSAGVLPVDPKFKHYDLMQFLDDDAAHNKTYSSVPSVLQPQASLTTNNTEDMLNHSSSSSTSAKKRKAEESEINAKVLEIFSEAVTSPKQMSGLDGFLISLGEALGKLPYRKRAQLEITFLQMAFDAENDN